MTYGYNFINITKSERSIVSRQNYEKDRCTIMYVYIKICITLYSVREICDMSVHMYISTLKTWFIRINEKAILFSLSAIHACIKY